MSYSISITVLLISLSSLQATEASAVVRQPELRGTSALSDAYVDVLTSGSQLMIIKYHISAEL